MYKRHSSQMSLFDEPEMFGALPLDPSNEWVKLSKLVPWAEFEYRYEENFDSRTGQPACAAAVP